MGSVAALSLNPPRRSGWACSDAEKGHLSRENGVAQRAIRPGQEGTFSLASHSPDALVVAFDDGQAVANAGLLLPATLAQRLGVEAVVDDLVDRGDRPGHHRPGRKVLTLVHALVAGGDCIDDAEALRTGSTAQVLSHRVMAPSTLGTFLRSFTFGHVRQLDQSPRP